MARASKQDNWSVMLCPGMLKDAKNRPDFKHKKMRYPVRGSVKFNGNRLFVRTKTLLTRNMILQRNKGLPEFMQRMVEHAKRYKLCFDVENVEMGEHLGGTTSVMNSFDKQFTMNTQTFVFDVVPYKLWINSERQVDIPFEKRYAEYRQHVDDINKRVKEKRSPYVATRQKLLEDADEAKAFFEKVVDDGEEGIITKHVDSPYYKDRCTATQAYCLKWKLEETMEGTIIGIQQGLKMRKGIERTVNAWERKEQPTKNDKNYEPDDIVGAFDIKLENGVETQATFAIGWDHVKRRALWRHQKKLERSGIRFPVPSTCEQPSGPLIGQVVECLYIPHGEKAGGKKQSARVVRFRPDKT